MCCLAMPAGIVPLNGGLETQFPDQGQEVLIGLPQVISSTTETSKPCLARFMAHVRPERPAPMMHTDFPIYPNSNKKCAINSTTIYSRIKVTFDTK